jgi:hypothetical protein
LPKGGLQGSSQKSSILATFVPVSFRSSACLSAYMSFDGLFSTRLLSSRRGRGSCLIGDGGPHVQSRCARGSVILRQIVSAPGIDDDLQPLAEQRRVGAIGVQFAPGWLCEFPPDSAQPGAPTVRAVPQMPAETVGSLCSRTPRRLAGNQTPHSDTYQLQGSRIDPTVLRSVSANVFCKRPCFGSTDFPPTRSFIRRTCASTTSFGVAGRRAHRSRTSNSVGPGPGPVSFLMLVGAVSCAPSVAGPDAPSSFSSAERG